MNIWDREYAFEERRNAPPPRTSVVIREQVPSKNSFPFGWLEAVRGSEVVELSFDIKTYVPG
jgi:hypothetical protein